jgi:CHAT domain-containing protein
LLAFGNPVLGAAGGGNAQRSALSSVAGGCRTDGPMPAGLLRSLASLPDTATEVQAVARTLGAGANVNLAGNATEARLRGDGLDRYRVLYFATHGLLPGELKCQGEPGLVLTPPATAATSKADDGLLEASEVAGLSLNADLVVLSACNTAAGGASLGGEAMSGLSEAFFHAGARNMIVSHWQVPSAATTALMTGLFGTLGTSSDASGALRAAQMRLADNAQTAHPFFWAAFVLMGAGETPTAPTEAGR